jgi:branched-chain amino acid transport system permease protein
MAPSRWLGGYITVLLMQRLGVPFLVCLPLAFIGAALLGAVLERTLYRPHVQQAAPRPGAVLDRPGLHGGGRWSTTSWVRTQQNVQLPDWLQGPHRDWRRRAELGMGHYRLFIIAVCAAADAGAAAVLARTRFGSRLRAAVDDPRVAARPGHQREPGASCSPSRSAPGLAGLGGALGAEVLGLDPSFPLKYTIYFLIVLSVGGTTYASPGRCWPRCCWALPTWRASTTCPSWAPSSSTR